MTKKQKRFIILSFGSIFLALILSTVLFVSCSDNTAGKIPFSPESGLYTLYFEEGWTIFNTENPYMLSLSNAELAFILTVEGYSKSNISEQGISNLDDYIDAYKQAFMAQEIYENEYNRVDTNIESFKEKLILNGKRQKIYVTAREEEYATYVDSTIEFIYFETKDFYFTVLYSNANEKFGVSQRKVHDAIKTLKIN